MNFNKKRKTQTDKQANVDAFAFLYDEPKKTCVLGLGAVAHLNPGSC
jgi:hypothetical protein